MKQNNPATNIVVIAIVIGVGAAGAGFFGGMKYQQSKFGQMTPSTANKQRGQNMTGGGSFGGVRPIIGEIKKIDKESIIVQLKDGSSKIIILSGTSLVSKTEYLSVNDLQTGTQVGVFGTLNEDGSVTAQNIQIDLKERLIIKPTPAK